MPVFRLAARLVARHRIYLAVYLVFLAVLSLLYGLSLGGGERDASGGAAQAAPKVAVVDRDGSVVSGALAAHVLADAEAVELADERSAIQDAVARSEVAYVLVVPEGFGADLAQAAASGTEAPALGRVVASAEEGPLVDERARSFAQVLRGFLATGASEADAAAWALSACAAEVEVAQVSAEAGGLPDGFYAYATMSLYALFSANVVCCAVSLGAISRGERRRRLAASPVGSGALGAQVALACLVLAVASWAFVAVVGLVAFGGPLAQAAPAAVAVVLAAQLAVALVGLSVGVLLWQLGCDETAANAAGNILGLVFTFLGGAWSSPELMDAWVRALASFTPVLWAVRAMWLVGGPGAAGPALADALVCLGVVALFSVAVAALALAVGRVRCGGEGVRRLPLPRVRS